MWRRAVTLANARVVADSGVASSIRFASRVLSLDDGPGRSDVVVDVDGAFVLPGLVNAHDHLELNHYGRLKFRDSYENASQWIDDMRPRLREDPVILEGRAEPTADRAAIAAFLAALNAKYAVAYGIDFLDPAVNATVRVRPAQAIGILHTDFRGSPTRWRFPDGA